MKEDNVLLRVSADKKKKNEQYMQRNLTHLNARKGIAR